MPTATIDIDILSKVVEDAVHKALDDEIRVKLAQLILYSLPYVSDEEQAELEEKFGSVEELKKGEFINVTDRVAPTKHQLPFQAGG